MLKRMARTNVLSPLPRTASANVVTAIDDRIRKAIEKAVQIIPATQSIDCDGLPVLNRLDGSACCATCGGDADGGLVFALNFNGATTPIGPGMTLRTTSGTAAALAIVTTTHLPAPAPRTEGGLRFLDSLGQNWDGEGTYLGNGFTAATLHNTALYTATPASPINARLNGVLIGTTSPTTSGWFGRWDLTAGYGVGNWGSVGRGSFTGQGRFGTQDYLLGVEQPSPLSGGSFGFTLRRAASPYTFLKRFEWASANGFITFGTAGFHVSCDDWGRFWIHSKHVTTIGGTDRTQYTPDGVQYTAAMLMTLYELNPNDLSLRKVRSVTLGTPTTGWSESTFCKAYFEE
jgi:hypothetical protein